jgi:hypothetical protein
VEGRLRVNILQPPIRGNRNSLHTVSLRLQHSLNTPNTAVVCLRHSRSTLNTVKLRLQLRPRIRSTPKVLRPTIHPNTLPRSTGRKMWEASSPGVRQLGNGLLYLAGDVLANWFQSFVYFVKQLVPIKP